MKHPQFPDSPIRSLLVAGLVLAMSAPVEAQSAKKTGLRPKTQEALVPAISSLRLQPDGVTLRGAYADARVLVAGQSAAGTQDLSSRALLRVLDPKIAVVDADGAVHPRRNGTTFVIAKWQGKEARIPVTVSGMGKSEPPRFIADVMPIMTHAGCNQGACHGAASGKGGFKLSLLGYDPESDYTAITRANLARRVAVAQPENSLLLRKPVLAVAHRGGKRFEVGSSEYNLLRDWIAGGMPGPVANEAAVAKLEFVPPVQTLAMGKTQRFVVRAHYSDHTMRDVTSETLFTASDETVATVTPVGEAKVTGNGESAVIARYQGLVATARVISPYGPPKSGGDTQTGRPGIDAANAEPASAVIDRLGLAKLNALGLEPSPHCTDADFLRRVYLDVTGRVPTPDESRAFLTDTAPQKRDRLIDTLLACPEYVDFWTMKWGDILRCSRQKLGEKGMYAFHDWIRQSVADNKPWDQVARELILAQGSAFRNGASNFYRTAAGPQELAETTSEVFLGVRIACARCHNHPYEKWTQNQYYQMAAFFARTGTKAGDRTGDSVLFVTDGGDVRHPKTQKIVAPCALDAAPVADQVGLDRRKALADWLTAPQNPFFTHIVVNRIWRHYMGRGFVEPVDDLRATNPPSNEALFDWLAQDLSRHHYDLKYLMRSILRSQTYQRSPEPTRNNERDSRYYSHFAFKRLGAEQLLDAVTSATGVGDKFDGFPLGMRACELPDTSVASYFLDLFGRPARSITCECERADAPNLGQILHLMNDAGINARISDKNGHLTKLMAAKMPDAKLVEELYLSVLCRFPTPEESRKSLSLLGTGANRQRAGEDLMWALLNSKEFVFNH